MATMQARILVVDDEVELMNALCESLADAGYETAGATSGAQGLAALDKQDFDLLLSDLMMPGMDGIELLRKALLRRSPESQVAFTIIASGENSASPHHDTGARKLRQGEVVIIDFGTRYEGYNSDITVTCAVGEPSDPEVREVYRVVWEAQQKALEAVRRMDQSALDLEALASGLHQQALKDKQDLEGQFNALMAVYENRKTALDRLLVAVEASRSSLRGEQEALRVNAEEHRAGLQRAAAEQLRSVLPHAERSDLVRGAIPRAGVEGRGSIPHRPS